MLTRAVAEMDFDPRPVADAEQALRSLRREPAEIALVDLGLPGMSGLDLCRRLREDWPEVQIIILTGYGDLDAAKQAIRLDVVDFLTKPCDHRELEIALDRALRRSPASKDTVGDAPEQAPSSDDPEGINARGMTIEQLERRHILDALRRNHGNRDMTARELGISLRTLYYRLSRYKVLDGLWDDPGR